MQKFQFNERNIKLTNPVSVASILHKYLPFINLREKANIVLKRFLSNCKENICGPFVVLTLGNNISS